MAPGLTGIVGGRPKVSPVIRLFSCLVDKQQLNVSIHVNDKEHSVAIDTDNHFSENKIPPQTDTSSVIQTSATVPLIKLAYARSGDKGNHANIGVIARNGDFLPYIKAALSEAAVADYFQHVLDSKTGKVSCWDLVVQYNESDYFLFRCDSEDTQVVIARLNCYGVWHYSWQSQYP